MSSYYSRTVEHRDECLALVSLEDAKSLGKALQECGAAEWCAWEWDNREEAIAFLRAAPANRLRKKAWQDPATRARLALAAHNITRLATVVLDHAQAGFQGMECRVATEHDARLALCILEKAARRQWPFPCQPPFPEWKALRWNPDCEDDYDPGFSPPGWETFQEARERADGDSPKE